MIAEPAEYFARGCGRCARFDGPDCSARLWAEGLAALRRLCLQAGLQEVAKWGHPTYVHAGRNLAILAAFRGDFRLTFPDARLLQGDAAALLVRPGPNSRTATTLVFHSKADVARHGPAILVLLDEAKAHASAGRRPASAEPRPPPTLSQDLAAALAADPALAAAFAALTPGRQRSYELALGSAKTPQTRQRRIASYRAPILAGKGAQER